jgi:hypothetical protein
MLGRSAPSPVDRAELVDMASQNALRARWENLWASEQYDRRAA